MSSLSRNRESLSFEIFHPDVVNNPYPTYREMALKAPLYWDAKLNCWISSRYDSVAELFRHPLMSSDRVNYFFYQYTPEQKKELERLHRLMANMCMFQDPPSHTRLRALITNAFNPQFIHTLKDKITQNIHEILGTLKGQTSFDFVTAIGFPLPLVVVGDLVGVHRSDRVLLKKWSVGLARFVAGMCPYEQAIYAMECSDNMIEYFKQLIADRRANPRNDFISMLVKAEDQGKVLSDEEINAMLTLVLIAGHETTTNLLANAVFHILKRPEQLALVQNNPGLYSGFVEETLRYESPIHLISRIVTQDFIHKGTSFKKGERVMLLIGAAHRDPEHFTSPDDFDVRRVNKKNIAFGIGAHFCPGAPLARLEGEIALRSFFETYPNISLDLKDPAWTMGALRTLKSLPLVVG